MLDAVLGIEGLDGEEGRRQYADHNDRCSVVKCAWRQANELVRCRMGEGVSWRREGGEKRMARTSMLSPILRLSKCWDILPPSGNLGCTFLKYTCARNGVAEGGREVGELVRVGRGTEGWGPTRGWNGN